MTDSKAPAAINPAQDELLILLRRVLEAVAAWTAEDSECSNLGEAARRAYWELVSFETGGEPHLKKHLLDTPKLVYDDLRYFIEHATVDLGDLSDADKGALCFGFLREAAKSEPVQSFLRSALDRSGTEEDESR